MDMEVVTKYIIMFVVTLIFKWVFATCFHFGIKSLHENYSEPDSQQVYVFFKYLSWAIIVVLFSIILLWDKVGFVHLTNWNKFGISLFGFYLLYYLRSSIKLMSHFINLLYFPQLAGDKVYTSVFGDVKKIDEKFYLIHDSSRTKIDITKRVL